MRVNKIALEEYMTKRCRVGGYVYERELLISKIIVRFKGKR